VNDPDQTMSFSSIKNGDGSFLLRKSDGLDDAWTSDDFTTDEDNPTVDRTAAFASLAFIGASLKRSAWVWCTTAVLGLLLGYAVYGKFPPAFSATTSVLVANNPNTDSTEASATNVALATSQAVAGKAMQQLGLHQSVSSFIAAYTVTAPSNQVLVFQVHAPTSAAALQRAQALATSFLQFRSSYLENQQNLQVSLARQQVNKAQQTVTSINRQISALSGTSGEQAKLSDLQAQQTTAANALAAAQQNLSAADSSGVSVTDAMVQGSQILNSPIAVPHTFKASRLFYMVLAAIAGLAIAMAVIVVRALVSDRLRNRDDVAEAIEAPVMLSTGLVGTRLLPPLGRRSGRRALDVERLAAHLDDAVVPPPAKRYATLAVVDVDNARDVVPAVISLAVTWASQGKRVILADLSHGAAAARRLGVKRPGVHRASARGTELTVSVPGRDEIAPIGPLPTLSRPPFGHVNPGLAAACGAADYLLTLVTLDPVAGGDHLATWATDAVAVVTAGQSSSTRIRAVGEMIRLAKVRLSSVVLLKADKSDESLGVLAAAQQSAPPRTL
jgi:capsular polysaccharide biosynthesis protein